MKKILKPAALCALIALTAASCGKEEIPVTTDPGNNPPSTVYRYTFEVAEDDTRATLGSDGVFWEAGDMVGLYLGGTSNDEAEIDMDTTPKTVVLRSSDPIPDGTVAYAYYPFSDNNTNAAATTFNIPTRQSGGLVSAMPMAGIPTAITGGNTTTNGEIRFLNLASIIDFRIYGSDFTGETIQSVTFQADGTPLSGDAVLNLTAIDPASEETLAFSSWTSSCDYVTVNQNAAIAGTKEEAGSIYMVLAPGTYASGTITITTDAATYTFRFSGKSLSRNELKHYNMNLGNATRQALSVKNTFPYTEPFTSDKGDFVIEGGTGNEISYSSGYGAKISGRYDNQNHDVSTAMVSPWIDLSGLQGAILSFEHIINNYLSVADGAAAVLIMAEGDEVWSNLNASFPDKPSSGYSEPMAVSLDLSAYLGMKVRIKFAYKATQSSCGVWEIKNFKVDSYVPVPVYSQYKGTLAEGDYVIVYNGNAMKNTIDSNRLTYTALTISGTSIENPDPSIVWHIAPSGAYWTIYNAAAGKYAASTGANNKAQLLQSGTDDMSLWSVSGSTSYEFVNKYNAANSVNANLRNNGSYGFACYSTSTGGALTLYKLGYSESSVEDPEEEGIMPEPSSLPGYLGCFEIPVLSNVSFSGAGNEVTPESNPTQWYRYDTGTSTLKIVSHTFKNTVVSPNRVMRNYTLLQDYDKKCALWVACAMNNDVYPNEADRKDKWCYDPALPESWQPNLTSSYPDKGGYSYDRGHQLAASYRETTTDQVKMTCYFTNMTPQLNKLNTGKWQSVVETNVRNLGAATTGRDTLYVVSGPLFIGEYGTVEDKDGMSCARPTHYFQCFMKVHFNTAGAIVSAKGAAYLVDHVTSPTVQYVTIDSVEELAGFDFFPRVPASIQNSAEATATPLSDF